MKFASLTFANGMGNLPSDASCDDNFVELSENMIYEDGEYKPILKPFSSNDYSEMELLFVHDYGDYTNYIGIKENKLVWKHNGYKEIFSGVNENIGITSIGNTLIVKNGGIRYFLFKGEYVELGQLPPIDATVSLEDVHTTTTKKAIVKYYVENTYNDSPDTLKILEEHRKELNDALTGHVLEVLNDNKKDGYFHFAFFVRLAYRMYDGSHSMMTDPILMYASVDRNESILGLDYSYVTAVRLESMRYYPNAKRLKIVLNGNLSDYSDIIDGVDVFVSEEVIPYDFNEDWAVDGIFPYTSGGVEEMETFSHQTISDDPNVSADIHGTFNGNCFESEYGFKMWKHAEVLRNGINGTYQEYTIRDSRDNDPGESTLAYPYNRAIPKRLSENQVIRKLSECSVFYKIFEMGLSGTAYADEEMENNTLLNLTSRTQLEHDDYYNHCNIDADTMFAYNGRLHLGNLKRDFFNGYKTFMPSTITQDEVRGSTVTSYLGYIVEIHTPSGKRYIQNLYTHTELIGYYFYYPDPRAKRVYFILSNCYVSYDLKKHPYLNGAYLLRTLPRENKSIVDTIYLDLTVPINNTPEVLTNQLVVSEVNNPYNFSVDGYEEIGSGRIMGMSSNTEALTDGEFGTFPLYVFTDEGIWAIFVNNDGTYGTAKPLSREVCNNPKSITQTDNAVFFTSKKGLMCAYGKTVKCVSNAMMGKEHAGVHSFRNCLSASKIAYDYKNSRLWIIDGTDTSYVYSIKNATFSTYVWDNPVMRVANKYPDNLIQDSTGKVFSLMETPDMNDDSNVYECRLITRPLKLGGVFKHKKIMMWDHITEGEVETKLYACDKLSGWVRVLKYHRFWRFLRIEMTIRLTSVQAWSGLILKYDVHREHRLFNNDRD